MYFEQSVWNIDEEHSGTVILCKYTRYKEFTPSPVVTIFTHTDKIIGILYWNIFDQLLSKLEKDRKTIARCYLL